jgi:hypothetical protein
LGWHFCNKRNPVGVLGFAIGDSRYVVYHRVSHCIFLTTVRFRAISGFISADRAECRLQFLALSMLGLLRFERKLGVSLFGPLLRFRSGQ